MSESPTSKSPSPGPSSASKPEESPKDGSPLKDTEDNSSSEESKNTTEKDAEGSKPAASSSTDSVPNTSSNPWQAIFSPQYNAYYFFNPETNETTWENPLLKAQAADTVTDPASSSSNTAPTGEDGSSYDALQAAAISQGIDPSLAYLDPSLAGPAPGSSSGQYGTTAKFNARTGQFARVDARDPSHLSEYERAKRMSEFYFDVNAWEKQRAEEQEEAAGNEKKRKRPSKKDLERFKEQKKQKKIAKTAWLRT